MPRIRSDAENVIQSACADALAVYFDREKIVYRQLWTYANQQGDDDNKFCGDLIGVIHSSTLLLMEFKSLDHQSEELSAFDEQQFKEAVAMQDKGIPLIYCYDNHQPLPYYEEERLNDWPERVLQAINATRPRELKGLKPLRALHGTLLDWIVGRLGEQPTNRLQAFGKAIGCMMPNMARNKLIAVLFSKQKNEALVLNEDGLAKFHSWIVSLEPNRDAVYQGKIDALRAAIKEGKKLTVAPKAIQKKGFGR